MTASREFADIVKERAEGSPAFREALLAEAIGTLISGDVPTGKVLLRHYINATVGFERLAAQVGTPAKSLMRMLSEKGNPTARNLFAVISRLQKMTGVRLSVEPARDAA